jgi:Histidine kinase-, DNA gyrase B-, and HSP90-like ATPase
VHGLQEQLGARWDEGASGEDEVGVDRPRSVAGGTPRCTSPSTRVTVDTLGRSAVEDETSFDREDRPPAEVELAMFRIASEAVANSVRHDMASSISISGTVRRDRVAIVVSDNGHGLAENPLGRRPGKHIGLSAMRRRAQGSMPTFLSRARQPGQRCARSAPVATSKCSSDTGQPGALPAHLPRHPGACVVSLGSKGSAGLLHQAPRNRLARRSSRVRERGRVS